jgi:hypothetical protein
LRASSIRAKEAYPLPGRPATESTSNAEDARRGLRPGVPTGGAGRVHRRRRWRADLEDAADARHRAAVGLHEALHEDEVLVAQQLRLALTQGAERRRGEVVDLQVDRGRKRCPISRQHVGRDRQQHVAERRHHAAVADSHLVAMALLDAKAELERARCGARRAAR